ncbi:MULTISPECIES: UvrD-helicase domain-containing protein [unclassified Streptomyces]|uniref:UvrD-helicase domain-containing protein n=1 Tax=unclassified Streptomyces TaxID=2593676 RepID=UPI00088353BE|nr:MULTISPECIES: UvrD-helicase domain-containing protein [unclassified Streptomyces]SDR59674.1 UvrD/REP helicase N-terminal domain-containing protein [Streptomyces sp. KS_16]SEB66973.1 UvrD/REP helicase N-terminal domain-containing protein [Streptomyces sp. 2133.1]SEF18203.1 UvrD/REP helicase N-terminal domain-containing protein [Streptomyces sp. 2112.3]PBC80233.1 UvrD-like helicase family protein [Streptomyces sp. 2321.6]SNC59415.1 UvrD-like helicase C-terminal domain-containing protein [Stre
MEPTKEQQAAREVFASGRDLALVAGAGTGKTSTLILMGAATRKRGLYVAFNRSIADDARGRFGSNVECRTAHSLAFRAVGHHYRERLDASARIPAKHTARLLGITRDLDVNSRQIKITHAARLVMGMVRKFCYTTDRQVMARHMEPVNGLDGPGQDYLARTLLPYAHRAWEDICSPAGRLRFEHDHYMKLWAMTAPQLGADFVLLDEAQDTNPVLEEVFLAQDAQRVCVGDPAQQIYGWRNARDVMTGFPADQLRLTQSFRFGPAIAEVANRWLGHAESEMQLTGHGPGSRVGEVAQPEAVLCRGNVDAMSEVLSFLEFGIPVALTGGGSALQRIAKAALELKAGQRTSHPELFLFSSWGEVQEYAEQDKAGQDLKAIVQLVDTYGPDQIITAVDRLSPEEKAQVTVSTAHKAKGREWPSVRIGKGFIAPSVDDHGLQRKLNASEARLIYVAVTRARHLLDTEGITWIDEYEKTMADAGRDGTVAGRPMIELSLTGQLKYDSSPISQFMAAHLPYSQNLVRDYQSRIACLPHPVQPIDVQYPNWTALGHAIDYRLRLSLGGRLGLAVVAGVTLLDETGPLRGAPARGSRKALHAAGRKLLATVDTYLADPSSLDENALIRLCFVAGFFEDVARTGEIRRFSMLAQATAATTLDDLTAAVPEYVVTDIDQQTRLADGPFATFRALPQRARVCGPVFAGSGDIGGADADYILGGLLLDCKATKDPHRLGREEIYQLAGYLLLDYDDQFGIDQVGLYLSRQGGLITWEAADFLRRLGAAMPLAQLRAQLRQHLHDAGGGR